MADIPAASRRRFQFRLRTLMIAVTLLAACAGKFAASKTVTTSAERNDLFLMAVSDLAAERALKRVEIELSLSGSQLFPRASNDGWRRCLEDFKRR
jgi:hypothetical protein